MERNFLHEKELTGQTTSHLIWDKFDQTYIHKDVSAKFQTLKKLASDQGLSLGVVSGFRSFELQKSIIEKKISGERPILDDLGHTKKVEELSQDELLFSILRWSALPGLSRHHWGSDFDIYDKNTIPDQYSIQLIPEEYEKGGPFTKLSEWLKELSRSPLNPGLFFPYEQDLGGVAREPWHISFSPLVPQFESTLDYPFFRRFIEENDIPLKSIILQKSEEIFERFIASSFFQRRPNSCSEEALTD